MTRVAIAREQSRRVDEPTLIARVLAGDRVAGRELYDAHAPRVYRLTFRLAGDAELAQEFTQETFIRAFGQLARFRGDAAFSTWIHRIAVSVTFNGMRKVKRFREREADLTEAAPLGAMPRDADPDLRARLADAIDALPEAYRTTVVMHDMEGYTHAEIASALGVPEGTCKSRLSWARARLREALADFRDNVME
ncbi:MAG: sigma-70 family RNA polymerase sigma factor [Gemmatimonadaceae bacterium]